MRTLAARLGLPFVWSVSHWGAAWKGPAKLTWQGTAWGDRRKLLVKLPRKVRDAGWAYLAFVWLGWGWYRREM